jgi:hypothetical protein
MHDNVILAGFGHKFAHSILFDHTIEAAGLQSKETRRVIPARWGW